MGAHTSSSLPKECCFSQGGSRAEHSTSVMIGLCMEVLLGFSERSSEDSAPHLVALFSECSVLKIGMPSGDLPMCHLGTQP